MNAEEIALRPATMADATILHSWRNSESARASMRNQNLIDESSHKRWLSRVLRSEDSLLLVAISSRSEPLGMIRLDRGSQDPTMAEVSVIVDDGLRGKGVGSSILNAVEAAALANWPDLRSVQAQVRSENSASLKLFRRAGYRDTLVTMEKSIRPMSTD